MTVLGVGATGRESEAAARGGALPPRAVLLVAALVVAALALAPRAEAFVYWIDLDAVARADLDGTGVDGEFIPLPDDSFATNVAVDGAHIYWTNQFPRSIGRANLDGTGEAVRDFMSVNARSVAVDGGHIYWANETDRTIGRANLNGTGVDEDFIPLSEPVFSVTVAGGHIYWAGSNDDFTQGSIGRANLNGTGVDEDFIASPDYPLRSVAVDAAHIYWTQVNADLTGGGIGRANLDGTGADAEFIPDPGNPVALAVDAAHIYWTNAAGLSAMGRANLDGSGADKNFIAGGGDVGHISGVAVDSGASGAVQSGFSFGKVKRNKKKGTAKLTVEVSGPGEVELAESKKVEGTQKTPQAAGDVTLQVKPKGEARKKLNRVGKAKVKAKVFYFPDDGTPLSTESKKLVLKKR